ncbi:unnamed protein product [Arctia plantaginis]|uniref:Apoptosis regulatory protein Siva n=1 Tax=Arctia plantaginis TaxID=874455 RepID=A0A8S1BLC1_ARCPL|nr:unnamed protein product [Arctia plantaginis]
MAKRANPFIEDYIPQSKIHVSLKQFNNNEDRLQKVYVKTLDLLYKGAKKCTSQDIVNTKDDNVKTIDTKNKMKQLFIGKNGSLLNSGTMVCNISKLVTERCSCGVEGESKCAYCEVPLCMTCQHVCAHCDRSHCTTCTLTRFEASEVCVSCYS